MLTKAELSKLTQEQLIELLAKNQSQGSSIKVSQKGAVSLYGLGRFPVTLYASQWDKLFSKMQDIQAFISNNSDKLKHKEE